MAPVLDGGLICIIDDDPGMRTSLADLMRSAGYRAVMFESADAFLISELVEACQCVLTDIHMPGKNGIQLLDVLRDRGVTTPVIVLTARAEHFWEARAVAGGAVGFLRKPFAASALFALIQAAVG